MALGKKKRAKRYPYVDVEGIDSAFLDACLLLTLDTEIICNSISDEKAVISKSNLSMKQIITKNVDKLELIRAISPLIKESYSLYNYLVSINMATIEKLIDVINSDASTSDDELKNLIEEEVFEESIYYCYYVTWLRFKEQFQNEIKGILEHFGNTFQEETGLLLGEDYILREKEGDTEDGVENSVEITFDSIIKDLVTLRGRIEKDTFREQYEEAMVTNKKFEVEIEELQKNLKGTSDQLQVKEQQLVTNTKEQSQLKKKLENEKKASELKNKEIGKLGSELGEIRKEVIELRKENDRFAKEIANARKIKDEALKSLEENLLNKYKAEKSLLINDYLEQIDDLELANKRLTSTMEDYKSQRDIINNLEDENNRLKKQLEIHLIQAQQRDNENQKEINQLKLQLESLSSATNTTSIPTVTSNGEKEEVDEFEEFGSFLDNIGKNEPKPV
ncbi:hypothetical protein PY093_19965 [Cytobacillus sp. S13-E01]|uniref:hypothetical protein n=1 Tax=Cytobacillus sp. S13-E01 TaxID=3031326 RepID=UPI0023D7ED8D|nr:hypothetical protein [Cytobacillus sp. S13-E01]MDF0728892.1 hypothetical protein [Cytobacillus sp. S13-E01]